MKKCPKCDTPMEPKGELDESAQDQSRVFYQCPNCKNIELLVRQFNHEFSMSYP
jgi:uncharacterized protein with PIN domain